MIDKAAADDAAVERGDMTELEARCNKAERRAKFFEDKAKRLDRAQLEAPYGNKGRGRPASPQGRFSSVPPPDREDRCGKGKGRGRVQDS